MKENERQGEQIVPQSEKADPVAQIPGYKNTVRDVYRLDDGTEVAIFYPQAICPTDEAKQSGKANVV